MTLVVDENSYTIAASSSGGDPVTVVVRLGTHTFSVKHGDTFVHDPKTFEIERDRRKVLTITATDLRLENGVSHTPPISTAAAPDSNGPLTAQHENTRSLLSDLDRTATGIWIPLFDPSTELPNPESMKLADGILELDNVRLEFPGIRASDCILRAEIRKSSGLAVGLSIRQIAGARSKKAYELWFEGTQLTAAMFRLAKTGVGESGNAYGPPGNKLLKRESTDEQFVDVALSAIGATLTLYVDGESVHSAKDP